VNSRILKPGFYFLIVAFQFAHGTQLNAQLSPGDLTQVHAELEGITNCTQCHTLGEKISSDKCLKCHESIKSLIDHGRGYHASATVRNQECTVCHSDHHGRKFDMIRFDTETFDHDLTGFVLYGAHSRLECAECHKREFIQDDVLKKRNETFLGMGTECLSCHDDFHQNTISSDCISCHNTDAFRPAALFEHKLTDFPLRGQHQAVDCAGCHEFSVRNGREFQQFAGIEFQNCNACHEDAHIGRFGSDCKQCHTEDSFQAIAGRTKFDHNTTDFPLRGQHQRIDCASCHDVSAVTQNVFRDFAHLDAINCTNCHDDVHANKFGRDCRSCHNEVSFQDVSGSDDFDHDLTSFHLEGKHVEVDCRSCHETKMTDPLPHDQCISCHSDDHEGQFVLTNNIARDCAECHTVRGFEESLFTIEQHNAQNFILEGAHLATPCFACHLKEDKWLFRATGTQCVDCHSNIHEGGLDEEYYPNEDCTICHSVDSWASLDFNHTLTGFDLEGAHLTTDCVACHLDEEKSLSMEEQSFAGLSSDCKECHVDEHRGQFEIDGKTQCKRCHVTQHWKPSLFDHNNTQFVLDGAHMQVACNDCHAKVTVDKVTYTKYKMDDFECVACHK
jgi:hypothetical protein